MPSFLAFPRIGRGVARTTRRPVRVPARAPTGAAEDASRAPPPFGNGGQERAARLGVGHVRQTGGVVLGAQGWRRARALRRGKRGRWRTTRSNRGSRSAWTAAGIRRKTSSSSRLSSPRSVCPPKRWTSGASARPRSSRATTSSSCVSSCATWRFTETSPWTSHQIDATLTQFLQSPASVESLRRGGALPPGPGEKTPEKAEKKAESAPRRARRDEPRARRTRRRRQASSARRSRRRRRHLRLWRASKTEASSRRNRTRRYLRAVPVAKPTRPSSLACRFIPSRPFVYANCSTTVWVCPRRREKGAGKRKSGGDKDENECLQPQKQQSGKKKSPVPLTPTGKYGTNPGAAESMTRWRPSSACTKPSSSTPRRRRRLRLRRALTRLIPEHQCRVARNHCHHHRDFGRPGKRDRQWLAPQRRESDAGHLPETRVRQGPRR